MTVADAVAVLEDHATDYAHAGIRVQPEDRLIITRAMLEIAGGWLTLEAPVLGDSFAIVWRYNGGAGGVHRGAFRSVEDCREWLEANADAIGGAA